MGLSNDRTRELAIKLAADCTGRPTALKAALGRAWDANHAVEMTPAAILDLQASAHPHAPRKIVKYSTLDDHALWQADRAAGMSDSAIARKHGFHQTAVSAYFRSAGQGTGRRGNRRGNNSVPNAPAAMLAAPPAPAASAPRPVREPGELSFRYAGRVKLWMLATDPLYRQQVAADRKASNLRRKRNRAGAKPAAAPPAPPAPPRVVVAAPPVSPLSRWNRLVKFIMFGR